MKTSRWTGSKIGRQQTGRTIGRKTEGRQVARQTGKQSNRQADIQAERLEGRQTGSKWAKKQMGRQACKQADRKWRRQEKRKTDTQNNEKLNRQADSQADRHTVQTERQAIKQVGRHAGRQEGTYSIYKQRLTFIIYATKKEGWGITGHGPVGVGPVDKAPGCCKVALGSNPRPSTSKIGSSKVDEQPTGGPTKIRGWIAPRKNSLSLSQKKKLMRSTLVVRASDCQCNQLQRSWVRSVESEGRQMKQCWIKYEKKIPPKNIFKKIKKEEKGWSRKNCEIMRGWGEQTKINQNQELM